MAMDIVDLAIENGDVPLCKRLPEAKRFTIMGLVLILGGYINGCNYVTMWGKFYTWAEPVTFLLYQVQSLKLKSVRQFVQFAKLRA